MVDSIRPTYTTIPTGSKSNKVKESSQVETYNDDTAGKDYIVTQDRRKQGDRRNPQNQQHPLYDLRSGKGRRKGDRGQPNIEIKI